MDIELDLTIKNVEIDLKDEVVEKKPEDKTNTTFVIGIDPENKSIKVGVKFDF